MPAAAAKKTDQQRYDLSEPLRPPRRTPAGFLEVDGYLGRTGVYTYLVNGSLRRELIRAEELFRPDSMRGYANVPATREHPPTLLTPETATAHAKGHVSGPARQDGDKLAGTLVIFDATLASEVEANERAELSPGYLCDTVEVPGVWEGIPYDAEQVNRRPNHVAVVMVARGGAECRVRLDALDGGMVRQDSHPTPPGRPAPSTKEDSMSGKKTMRIGAVSGEADAHLVDAYEEQLRVRQDSEAGTTRKVQLAEEAAQAAQKKAAELQARLDSETEAHTKVKAQLAEATDVKRLDAAVAERVAFNDRARRVLGSKVKLDGLSQDDIRRKVVLALAPTAPAEKLKDTAYLRQRFDSEMDRADESGLFGEEKKDGTCPACGAIVMDGAEKCPQCGAAMKADGERKDSDTGEVTVKAPARPGTAGTARTDGAPVDPQQALRESLANRWNPEATAPEKK